MNGPREQTIPVFGVQVADVACEPCLAAYAVIRGSDGRVAAVRGRSGYFLPGGGSCTGEPAEETILREVQEELGRKASITGYVGKAVQLFPADGTHYRMTAFFFEAVFVGGAQDDGEYELEWLSVEQGALNSRGWGYEYWMNNSWKGPNRF